MKISNPIRLSLYATSLIVLAGCTGTGNLEIRAVESSSGKIKGGPDALAEAHALLRLGNPGLALEAFRKIQRDHPSADALSGIAASYTAMGRDDLAKANLEAALALKPESPELLTSVATVMDRLGLDEEASAARVQSRMVVAPATSTVPTPLERAVAAVRDDQTQPRVTVSRAPTPRPSEQVAQTSAPRLERLSSREITLITSTKPFWAPLAAKPAKTAYSDPRWTKLEPSAVAPNIRILNAARVQGLANSSRAGLAELGWRRIDVGDNARVEERSVVLYPAGKEKIATALARHFGVEAVRSDGPMVTVVLGRDLAGKPGG